MRVSNVANYAGYECTKIENEVISLWVTNQVGPRVIGLELDPGTNLFAELPGASLECPGVGDYQLRGGHRLWQAPEDPRLTYLPDDDPLLVRETPEWVSFTQPTEQRTGIEKSLRVMLPNQHGEAIVEHELKNNNSKTVLLAPWAITQLKPGGTAILPQNTASSDQYGLLPNRQIALWPYTAADSDHITWGNKFILIHANMQEGALKVGFPNPTGWLGYLLDEMFFIKQAQYYPEMEYYDLGSSSECYCNPAFLELETLGPITQLEPGESLSHRETWQVVGGVDVALTEGTISELIKEMGL